MSTSDYRDLIVWQKSIDLVDLLYDATEKFPKKETFVLCSQMHPSGYLHREQHRRGFCSAQPS